MSTNGFYFLPEVRNRTRYFNEKLIDIKAGCIRQENRTSIQLNSFFIFIVLVFKGEATCLTCLITLIKIRISKKTAILPQNHLKKIDGIYKKNTKKKKQKEQKEVYWSRRMEITVWRSKC